VKLKFSISKRTLMNWKTGTPLSETDIIMIHTELYRLFSKFHGLAERQQSVE